MNQDVFTREFSKRFTWFSNESAPARTLMELDLYKKLWSSFLTGSSYYFVMNHNTWSFDLISNEVELVLGYTPEEITFQFLLDKMHPEDKPWFLAFGTKMISFFSRVPIDKLMKYKLRYDVRYQTKNGDHARILYQGIMLEHDADGKILRSFVLNTDISYLKYEGRPTLSFIGLDGEPSYIDVNVANDFIASKIEVTAREKQVLQMLAEGKSSKEISAVLNISKQTVDTHRKNMLRKNNLVNTNELVGKAIRLGWI